MVHYADDNHPVIIHQYVAVVIVVCVVVVLLLFVCLFVAVFVRDEANHALQRHRLSFVSPGMRCCLYANVLFFCFVLLGGGGGVVVVRQCR